MSLNKVLIEQTINASWDVQPCRCTKLVVKNQKIVQDMACINTQRVAIVAFMLAEETFLKEVLLEDDCNCKGMEFLKLK
ncbi:hypothetical protein CR513_00402, partial [Mucuna pruriens]